MQYIVKLTPLEPYFLGGERNYNYLGAGPKKYNYYIKSELLPAQTTLLGVLRFELLQRAGWLSTDFDYKNKKTINKLIGEKSFSYMEHKNKFDFGAIKSIGSLFLLGKDDKKYIRTPFNHNPQYEKYTPYKIEKLKGYCSLGEDIYFASDYKAKNYLTDSFMCLDDLSIVSRDKLFKANVKTRIHKKNGKNEEAYFKKESYVLNQDYSFAFAAEIDISKDIGIPKIDWKKKNIVYLGQDKSAFLLEFIDCKKRKLKFDLQNEVNTKFKNKGQSKNQRFLYALSNLKLEKNIHYSNSAIILTKNSRPLQTKRQKSLNGRYQFGTSLHQLIAAGSIFYDENIFKNNELLNEKYKKIGLNQLVKIGK